jgi:hypothetical protein
VTNGIVTHPNLVRFRGYVAKSGAVRASVTVQDKYATGAGKLFATSGRGDLERPLRNGAMLRPLDAIEGRNGGHATGCDCGANAGSPKPSYGKERFLGELETKMK